MNIEELQAENARLKALTAEMDKTINISQAGCRLLKAEVERLDTLCKQLMAQHSDISCENIMLRKAGDALGDSIEIYRLKAEVDLWKLRFENCLAAEGKPSV